MADIKINFSDFFGVSPNVIEKYGSFNLSLVADLPLFIDPFLLFNSDKAEYKELHEKIITYVRFLRDKSLKGPLPLGLIDAWFTFPEIKQNWLGFSATGNRGSGLGRKFAKALHNNLNLIFTNFGQEQITHGSHLERLCLIDSGVGKDHLSDFATNLIHEYLLNYTQGFALKHVSKAYRRKISVRKVRFNYQTETWENGIFELPYYNRDYILLTPKDILTKDEPWINRPELLDDFETVPLAIPNKQLRIQINNYFLKLLPEDPKKKHKREAAAATVRQFPEIVDYYIKYKEENGSEAKAVSSLKVKESEILYIEQIRELVTALQNHTRFYNLRGKTYHEAYDRVMFLKDIIENKDGYRAFYLKNKPIGTEEDLQIMYRLTWRGTASDVNREVNNGRGPVDFKLSRGSKDKTLVEFKLARNSKLKANLEKQVAVYEKANDTEKAIKVILYFTEDEYEKVKKYIRDIGMEGNKNFVLIDARSDNKPSASTA